MKSCGVARFGQLLGVNASWGKRCQRKEQTMDEAYQAYRSAAESPTIRSIWKAVYRDRLWEGGAPPLTMATNEDVQFVTDRLDPRATSCLVDLGCGSGCLSRHLA